MTKPQTLDSALFPRSYGAFRHLSAHPFFLFFFFFFCFSGPVIFCCFASVSFLMSVSLSPEAAIFGEEL